MHGKAKEETEISNEKEAVNQAVVQAMGEDRHGNVTEQNLKNALDNITGIGQTNVSDLGENYEVYFNKSKRYYEIDKEGNIEDYQIATQDKYPGDITKDEKGNILDGSESKPYEINCIEDLVAFSNIINKTGIKLENGKVVSITKSDTFNGNYIVLKRNLNFKSKYSYVDSERTDFGDINGDLEDGDKLITEMQTGRGFIPIGCSSNKFTEKTFDGMEHEIKNLYQKNIDGGNKLGLFGEIKKSVIKNIKVSGKIEVADGATENTTSVGGIASYGSGKFINCINNVNIKNRGYGAGGILGRELGNAEVINCVNIATIENTSESTGGIVGRSESNVNIYNSYNLGNINSTGQQAGGILGYAIKNVNITNVYNNGELIGNGSRGRGGIIGSGGQGAININIKNAYNMGKIVENNVNLAYGAGAICGYLYADSIQLEIQNSYYLNGSCSAAVGRKEDNLYGVEKLKFIELEQMKDRFNSYIENNLEGVDTSEWKKWKSGKEYCEF